MLKVDSIMSPISNYPTILSTESVATAFKELEGVTISPWIGNKTIVVVDAEGNNVGLLTIKSLLKAIDLDDPAMKMELKGKYWSSYFAWRKKDWANLKVSAIMRPLNKGIEVDTPLLVAAKKFIWQNVNTMPVIQDGKAVGLVNVYDICRFFANHV